MSKRRCVLKCEGKFSLHGLPKDDELRSQWLGFIFNTVPRDYNSNLLLCSRHFTGDCFTNLQQFNSGFAIRLLLKDGVVPTLFGSQSGDSESQPATAAQASTAVVSGSSVDSSLQWASVLTSGPGTSSQASSLGVQGTGVDTGSPSPSLPIPIASGAPSTSSQSPPPAELSESLCSVASVDCLNESFHQDAELRWTATSKSHEYTEKDLSQSKTIVNDSCLMELFKKCQTCGQPITKKKVSHCGAQKKVRWSCLGGHMGIWMSSPHLWEAFPEIHLLTALSVLFSGGTFTHFKKWAKHLHLNFMGHKTFFEIQKAYLNPEMKPIFAKGAHPQPEGTLHHISDPLKKIKSKSRRGEKGAPSSSSSYEKRSSILMTSTGMCMQEPTATSSLGHASASERGKPRQQDVEHQSETTHVASEVDGLQDSFEEMEVTIDEDECSSVKNRLSDLDSDMGNAAETTELSAAGVDDSCDEDVYVPIIPQRSTASELLLECEEEELEPWQKQTPHVHLKDEDDIGEFSNDQTDCKPEPSLLQRTAGSTSPPKVKTQTPQPVVFNSQGFIVASPQLTSTTEFFGSLGTQRCAGNSFTIVPATPQHLFQKVATATVKPEAYDVVHTSEVHEISNNPVSLSSVQSPAVYVTSSNQLKSDQSNSHTLSVPFSLPCFTLLELESMGTSNK